MRFSATSHLFSVRILRRLTLAFALSVLVPGRVFADSSLANGGFEAGSEGWKVYVPDESKDKNCRFDIVSESPHSGSNCAKLASDDFARFSIGSDVIPVQPGQKYRVTAWVRADSAASVRPKGAGFAIRFNLRDGERDAEGGHLFVAPENIVTRNTPAGLANPLPTEWTKIEVVIEIPPGVDAMLPGLFSWWTKGAIYVDDFTVEKVDASTEATPLAQAGVVRPPAVTMPAVPGPVTSDETLLAALNLDTSGMEKVKAAAQSGKNKADWQAVRDAYLEYRRTGSPAKWDVMPKDRPAQPRQKDDPAANRILAHFIPNVHRFPMPAEVDMGKDFNWTHNPVPRDSPTYDAEWTFGPIGRMEFWYPLAAAYWQTGDEKYAEGWVRQLNDFALKNPMHFDAVPGVPSLWRSLDSAIRVTSSWPNAYYHFLESPSFTPDANWLYLKLIYEHAQILLNALKDQSRSGNWVTTECSALFALGTLFPEFRDAVSWRQQAIDRLTKEMDRMVPPDGFEAELTPTYHFVALDGFRRPLEIAKLNGLTVPDNFRTKVLEMYRAAVLMMDQAGQNVPTNDSKVLLATLQAEAGLRLGYDPLLAWAASRGQKGEAPPESTALPYAGFYAMRGGWKKDDVFLFFRAGPTGIGHQHEDKLQVVMRAWNKTLIFDPGGYSYDESQWRRYSNGTASHNTVIVDGKWQHRGANKPPVSKPADNPWITSPLFDYVSGVYDDGYQLSVYRSRPFDPQTWKGEPDKSVSHTRRVLFLRPYYALVIDNLDGTGNHTFDAHFHLDSDEAKLDPSSQAAFSENPLGARLGLYPLERENLATEIIKGQKEPMLGWMPNEHKPIPSVRFRKQQDAPAIFATFLYPFRGDAPAFQEAPLEATGEGLWSRSLKTPQESAEIVLAAKGPTQMSFASPTRGAVSAEALGLVIRKSSGAGDAFIGGMDLRSFRDNQIDLALDRSASIVLLPQGGKVLCFNAGDEKLTVKMKRPFEREVVLEPRQWLAISKEGEAPVAAPALFKPLEASASGMSYAEYLKKFPKDSGAEGEPIRIKSGQMTIPAKAVLAAKVGAEERVLARWDTSGTVATAQVEMPKAGWYQVRVRYCSAESPVRSLLINGKVPFDEAEGFTLASTMGSAPSDGWSNFTADWKETILGAAGGTQGWKVYLPKGTTKVECRNDGGGLNLDWIELDPV